MSKQDIGGPAFPTTHNGSTLPGQSGLTMRDYFAAKAMQGLSQNIDWNTQTSDGVAGVAYVLADAMLRERTK